MVPKVARPSSRGQFFRSVGRKPFPSRRRMPTAIKSEAMFRKKLFWMVGTSPAIRTQTFMQEKQNAAIRMQRMPRYRLFFRVCKASPAFRVMQRNEISGFLLRRLQRLPEGQDGAPQGVQVVEAGIQLSAGGFVRRAGQIQVL